MICVKLFKALKRLTGRAAKEPLRVRTEAQTPSISEADYAAIRQAEIDVIEQRYDLSSAAGIEAIPVSDGIIRHESGFHSYTGDIDYYLRRKGFEYEEAGNLLLAILCLKKSNEIRYACRKGYGRDDYYSYVRMLARAGCVDEAKKEKAKIDALFAKTERDSDSRECEAQSIINRVLENAAQQHTDLVWMMPHGCACPECAKYQGRVFSISGRDPRFPKIPDAFWVYGAIHKGCGHSFHPHVAFDSGYELENALEIQKIRKRKFRKSIIAFSNRPFADDRPQEDINAALQHITKRREAEASQQRQWDEMIAFETTRGNEKRIYRWIGENLPEICPKSYSGYRRMKLQNTKNYQKIIAAAREKGKDLLNEAVPMPAAVKFCPRCGKAQKAGNNFCIACAWKLPG